jgi:formamidopyrimidine-DNA glycosylase
MPELPEVETVKRGLYPIITGSTISSLTLNRANLRYPFDKNLKSSIKGATCIALRRRGKYILMDFDNDYSLIIHLGMSGSFKINPQQSAKHDHVIFETLQRNRIVYNDPRRFGFILLIKTDAENDYPAFAAMGVEPLGNNFHGAYLFEKLQPKATSIKTALLDQSVVAGIGNIYACEALYMAGISPLRPANHMTRDKCDDLAQSIREVLTSAIESGGSSLRDHRQTDGAMGYFQHHFKVYDKQGTICPETGGKIIRVVQSGRSTFYCPLKQK